MKKSAAIIVVFWLLVIGILGISQEIILQNGRQVLLKTVPIDPKDITRGDYVRLDYEISHLNWYKDRFDYGDTIYVNLKKDENNIARLAYIEKTKPQQGKLFIKGKVTKCGFTASSSRNKCAKFGIESYFVKEGEGRTLEHELQKGGIAKVVIDKNGNAIVKSVEGMK